MSLEALASSVALEDAAPSGSLRNHVVALVGLGYVGLSTALSLSDERARIIGFDVSESRLTAIKDARVDLLLEIGHGSPASCRTTS